MDFWIWSYLTSFPVWISFLLLLLIILYRYGSCRFGVWRSARVPGPKPWPLIGNAAAMIRQGVRVFDQHCVSTYGDVVGLYEGSAPVLLVADPELLRQVFVKDFNNFMNRTASPLYTDKDNYVFRATLTRLMGAHWKHVRCHLTPTFSGSKLRSMMPHLRACADILLENLLDVAEQSVNLKHFCGAFSMDVIARTAFGLDIDSQKDPDNPFVRHARKVFEADRLNFRLLSIMLFPFLRKIKIWFGQNQFPNDVLEFFSKITSDLMKKRQNSKETRVDFLQLMLDNKIPDDCSDKNHVTENTGCLQWNKQGLTEEEILAQALLFFIAGYETTASTITFVCYCLATNMEKQRKLQQEIDRVMENQDEITYDILSDLRYLEMCIEETLRLYPPLTRILRACNQDTVLGEVTVRRGTLIAIPVYTLHHNPKYWHNPESFIPERFLPEQRLAHTPYTWLPFGSGPRNCIGIRLAIMEIKVAMVTLVKHLEFHVNKDTKVPLSFRKNTVLTTTKPIFLDVRKRRK